MPISDMGIGDGCVATCTNLIPYVLVCFIVFPNFPNYLNILGQQKFADKFPGDEGARIICKFVWSALIWGYFVRDTLKV